MIKLTRLNGQNVFVVKENIQWMEQLPDTTITFLGGARLVVKETLEEIMAMFSEYAQ